MLDIDGSSATTPFEDGLLIMRHLFGFDGPMLVDGIVSSNCQRCGAAEIKAYLSGLGMTLDVDGNGELGSLTDGVLALRFMFGFSDPVLTQGAVAVNCTRCDEAAVIEYLIPLTATEL